MAGRPDFVAGTALERVQELWRYGWRPDTESALTERSVYGGTLEEACATLLRERLRADADQGQGRRADRAAAHLLGACRMGLHRFTAELLARTTDLIAEDALFSSLVRTAEQLLLLHRAREPLEAHGLAGLRETALEAYRLALRGAAAGSLFVDGALDQDELIRLAVGHMRLGGPEFLRGLLRADRACLWQVAGLLDGLNAAIAAWDEPAFVRQLPGLRLAFADLTAHECDRVALQLAGMLGLRQLPALRIADATPEDLLTCAALNARLAEILADSEF